MFQLLASRTASSTTAIGIASNKRSLQTRSPTSPVAAAADLLSAPTKIPRIENTDIGARVASILARNDYENKSAFEPLRLASSTAYHGLGDLYKDIIHKTRYARFLSDKGRRENWAETCHRAVDALCEDVSHSAVDDKLRKEMFDAMYGGEVMPSMRLVMSAGPALRRDNMCAYNCSYLPIDSAAAFGEVLYILSCGSGVGFSCEGEYVNNLPVVPSTIRQASWTLQVEDSGVSWAVSLKVYLEALWRGQVPTVDYSKIRPAGARLHVMGGRASGPDPLRKLFEFAEKMFRNAAGRRLSSLEVHDLVCVTATSIVSGGVRRSALISLSDLDDQEMRDAKTGEWWKTAPYRACANNSAVYHGTPPEGVFRAEWEALVKSRAGERGIYNRTAAALQAGKTGRRKTGGIAFGINPCSEVILRPRGLCNLSEVIIRPNDSWSDLGRKVRIASVFGTLQSRLTKFNEEVLSPEWRKNAEEERLLGVSFAGILDNPLTSSLTSQELPEWLDRLRRDVVSTNASLASKIGIPPSVASTAVKPSGTTSQLNGCAAGIHPRWSPHQIRRVRFDQKDPAVQFLRKKLPQLNIEADACNDTQVVLSYPMRAPQHAVFVTNGEYRVTEHVICDRTRSLPLEALEALQQKPTDSEEDILLDLELVPGGTQRVLRYIKRDNHPVDGTTNVCWMLIERRSELAPPPRSMTSIDQLELWSIYNRYWCEHKPSISVYVDDNEKAWTEVGDWVYKNFDVISGMSFFPRNLGTYKQAPNEAISSEEYEKLAATLPKAIDIDWDEMREFETEENRGDSLNNSDRFACTSGACEL